MLGRLGEKTNTDQFYLPNWIDEKSIDPEVSKQHSFFNRERINILYSGNIGDKQDWDSFIEFCTALDPLKYDIIVVGDGAKTSIANLPSSVGESRSVAKGIPPRANIVV